MLNSLTPVFCYGSNNPDQLSERIGRRPKMEGAYLDDYHRIFVGFSRKWNGGVGSLEKAPGETVYGLVAYLSQADIKKLDGFEGWHPDNIRGSTIKKNLKITTQEGKPLTAIVYLGTATNRNPPSKAYREAVAKTISAFWSNSDGSSVSFKDITIRRNPEACSVCGGLTYIIKNLKCPPCEGTGKPSTFICNYCHGSKQCTQCKGTKVLITYVESKEIPCSVCNATGACRYCDGTGLPKCNSCVGSGIRYGGGECGFCNKGFKKFECEYCKGTGTQTTPCYKCNGTGTQKTKQEIADEEQIKRSEINAILRKEAKLLNLDNFKVTLLFKRIGEKEHEEVDYDQFPWAFPVAGQEEDIPSYYGDIEKGSRIPLIDAITNSRMLLRQSFLDLDLNIDSDSVYKFYSSNVSVFKDDIEIGTIVMGTLGRFFYDETDFITFLKWIVLTGRFGAIKHYSNIDLNEDTFKQMTTKIRNQVNYGHDTLEEWISLMKVLDGNGNADYEVLNDVRLMAFKKFKNISVEPFRFGF